ncbi:amino acid adenylation domain-containing protein [Streptosporangium sp. KLBMP 9127]|nr:amino acid adenylation domain-containing protein [Streptosporangium sp. KLBMP 9127]
MRENLLDRLSGLDPRRRATLLATLAERGEEFDIHPLSSAQRRLWLMAQLHPEADPYNVPYAAWLSGPLDTHALAAAVDDLVARHSSLRTVFLDAHGEPLQVVLPELTGVLTVEDVSATAGTSADGPRAAALDRAAAEAAAGFDLAAEPLIRVRLVVVGPGEALLLLTLHHIVCDGWSMGILFDDLEAMYLARCEGLVAEPEPVPWRYSDFARWQAEWCASSAPEIPLSYWTERLAGAPPILELPVDRPRPVEPSAVGGMEWFEWPAGLRAEVEALSRSAGVTPFAVLLAAYTALLSRYCRQDDIVIGTPAANRTRPEIEGVVGFFVNMLPIRGRATPSTSFRALVAEIWESLLAGQTHQELPFDMLVGASRLPRDAACHPIFQVACMMQDDEVGRLRLPGLRVTPLRGHSGTAKLDLTISFRLDGPDGPGLGGCLEYNTALFDAGTVRDLLDGLHTLLGGAMAEPDLPIGSLPILSPEQWQRIVGDWSHDAPVPVGDRLAHELVEERADLFPEAPAVLFEADRLSYRELDERANRLANHLRAGGAGPESIVGIFLARSADLVVCLLAVWKAGAAYLPLDPAYPADRLDYMIGDSRPALVLTTTDLAGRLPAEAPVLCLDAAREGLERAPATRPARTAGPDNLAYVIYTSGSTGRPKGAMLVHNGLRNLARAQRRAFGLGEHDRVLQFSSFSFDAAVFEIVLALTAGALCVLAPREALLPGDDLAGTMRANRITVAALPPTVAATLTPQEVPSLRTLLVVGEICPPEIAATWAGHGLVNGYGPTEITVAATLATRLREEGPVPIGEPIANVEVYVVDDRLRPVPRGVPGELCIGGPGLGRGYLGRPDITAERYVPDPFSGRAGARLYRSGDIVRFRADGMLEFLGRADGQVKIRGLRIELGEIQSVLARQPGIGTCVVTTAEETLGDVRLVAYYVPDAARPADPGELRRLLRGVLPEFMVPAAFVPIDAVPLTANGKIDHAALRRSPPDWVRPAPTGPAPGTGLERVIAGVWREVLQADHVGLDDNFFDVGGNSLLITKVRSRLARVIDQPIATLTLFRFPSVRALADHLGDTGPVPPAPDDAKRRGRGRQALLERSRRTATTRKEA